jgi:hypothetical protein
MNRMRPIPDEARPNSGGGTPMDMQTAMSIASEYGHVPQKLDGGGDPNNPNPVGIWGVPTENGYVEMGQLMQPGAGWNQQGDKYGYGGGGNGGNGGGGGEWNRPLGGGGGGMPEWAKSYDGNPFSQPRQAPPVAASGPAPSAMSNPDYPYSPQFNGGAAGDVGRAMAGGNGARPSAFAPPPAAAAPAPAQQGAIGAAQAGPPVPVSRSSGDRSNWPAGTQDATYVSPGPPPQPAYNATARPNPRQVQWPLPPGGNQGFAPTPQTPTPPAGSGNWQQSTQIPRQLNQQPSQNPDPTRNNSNVQPGGYYQPNDQFQLTPEQEARRNQIYGTTQQQGFAPQAPRAPQPRMLTIEMDDGTKVTYDAQKKAWIV